MSSLIRRDLPWREPDALARALAQRFGREGLVLLGGDRGPLGRRAVLGVDPLETVCCRGLPGAVGATDPFAALRAMGERGGPWLGWLAYEAAAWLEPSVPWREPEMATLWAVRHDPLIHFDLAGRRCWLEGRDPQRLQALAAVIDGLPGARADDMAVAAAWPASSAAAAAPAWPAAHGLTESVSGERGAAAAAWPAAAAGGVGLVETLPGGSGAAADGGHPDGLAAGLPGQGRQPAEAPRLDALSGVAAGRPVPPSPGIPRSPELSSLAGPESPPGPVSPDASAPEAGSPGGSSVRQEPAVAPGAVAPAAGQAQPLRIPLDAWRWHTTPQRYADQVGELLQRIAAGDLFQANLTACCETTLASPPDPLDLWERLSRACPAPFAGVAIASSGAAGEAVISASPERFLQLSPQGLVETRPIKGTRPRSADADRDAAAAAELVCDPKDRAENVMIVDLLRNDLGRVCEPGSIQVPQLVGLESYAQVHHLTSVVCGRLASGRDLVDLLRACWPGGSISGAPKLRACTRLHGLEPVPRGPYCGSLFHWDAEGGFDSSILIRSVMASGCRLRVHAGGGIVADSDPAAEAEEMGWKIQPLLEALA